MYEVGGTPSTIYPPPTLVGCLQVHLCAQAKCKHPRILERKINENWFFLLSDVIEINWSHIYDWSTQMINRCQSSEGKWQSNWIWKVNFFLNSLTNCNKKLQKKFEFCFQFIFTHQIMLQKTILNWKQNRLHFSDGATKITRILFEPSTQKLKLTSNFINYIRLLIFLKFSYC